MPPNVLVVDDHPIVLRMVKEQFEAHGFDVATAASAREAIETLARSRFDLVMTDIRMETATSGFAVVQAAKAQAYKPVVVISSAYAIPAPDWRKAGADAMFLKEGGMAKIFAEVERLLRERAA